MAVIYEWQESDKSRTSDELICDIATLISVLSAHQAVHSFSTDKNRILYLFMLISDAHNIIKTVDQLPKHLEALDNGNDDFEDDEPDIVFKTLEEFLNEYFNKDDEEEDDGYGDFGCDL
jgi:hypothetical protein